MKGSDLIKILGMHPEDTLDEAVWWAAYERAREISAAVDAICKSLKCSRQDSIGRIQKLLKETEALKKELGR